MSHELISRSPDLRRLRNEGFDVEIRSGHLLLKSVPYVNPQRHVEVGILVSELSLAGDVTTKPTDHVVRFIGNEPCDSTGRPLEELINSRGQQILATDVVVDFVFSQKPINGYDNYYDKMTTYAAILCAHAQAVDPTVKSESYPVLPSDETDAVFEYIDTASSRAGISAISSKLALSNVAVVGLGGTGSYILDLLAKTPIRSIHLFDGDLFLQHNAFRSPGAPSIDDLLSAPFKVEYFGALYSRMRRGIIAHRYFLGEENADELKQMDFAFLSMDGGEAKRLTVATLEEFDIPFIDVGMGLYRVDDSLGGQLRVSTNTSKSRSVFRSRVTMGAPDADNAYEQNIQIADLNALNATLAVIKWKKMLGFYSDLEMEHSTIFVIDGNQLINEVTN